MSTTVLSCPSCRAPVRFAGDVTTAACGSCGAVVTRGGSGAMLTGSGERARQNILAVSLLVVAAGFLSLALLQRRRHPDPPAEPPPSTFVAPQPVVVTPTPAGEIAWELTARAPVLTAVNNDATEDILGFLRVWDGRSAWVTHAGAFDGATLKPLWRSEPLDPQLVKRPGVVPLALVLGARVALADTSSTLRVVNLASGEKQLTMNLTGPIVQLCAVDRPDRVWVGVEGGGDTIVDLVSERAELAARPRACPPPPGALPVLPTPKRREQASAQQLAQVVACNATFVNALLARSTCRAPAALPDADSDPGYELSDGALSVKVGLRGGQAFAGSSKPRWEHAFAAEGSMTRPSVPSVSDLAFGRFYAVYERGYFDARLVALDAQTGDLKWEATLLGSVTGVDGAGAGEARTLVATSARVYVARSGGELDVFDATSGAQVGAIGKR